MKPTDHQYQLALAKMLPEKILKGASQCFWLDAQGLSRDMPIQDTEWLHVCWLVEQELKPARIGIDCSIEWQLFVSSLGDIVGNDQSLIHASWQQRTQALCKVKGIEL